VFGTLELLAFSRNARKMPGANISCSLRYASRLRKGNKRFRATGFLDFVCHPVF
jgi:hypothetical protein